MQTCMWGHVQCPSEVSTVNHLQYSNPIKYTILCRSVLYTTYIQDKETMVPLLCMIETCGMYVYIGQSERSTNERAGISQSRTDKRTRTWVIMIIVHIKFYNLLGH